jgi:hypothetical protein
MRSPGPWPADGFTGETDGGNPEAGLINSSGALYDTTFERRKSSYGTAFKLVPGQHPAPVSDNSIDPLLARQGVDARLACHSPRQGGAQRAQQELFVMRLSAASAWFAVLASAGSSSAQPV